MKGSLTATMSISSCSMALRKTIRPILPKPLMPTLIGAMIASLFEVIWKKKLLKGWCCEEEEEVVERRWTGWRGRREIASVLPRYANYDRALALCGDASPQRRAAVSTRTDLLLLNSPRQDLLSVLYFFCLHGVIEQINVLLNTSHSKSHHVLFTFFFYLPRLQLSYCPALR